MKILGNSGFDLPVHKVEQGRYQYVRDCHQVYNAIVYPLGYGVIAIAFNRCAAHSALSLRILC